MATRAEMVLVDPGKPAITLDIPKGQSFDDWVEMGRRLAETDRRIQWWIGDWWAAGSHRYGERAKVAAEGIFGRQFQTLANAASVSRSFETSRRREALSFSHHVEVAPLPPKEADALLERAEEQQLSVRELRIETIKRKVALGLFQPRDEVDDDPEHTALVAIARAWNRAPVGARETFADLIGEANLGEIDP